MASRPPLHRSGTTSPYDVPGQGASAAGDDLDAGLAGEGFPLIAPPLLLEPVPPPVILTPRAPTPTPEPEAIDAYALAAAAASAMEREGRTFDSPLEFSSADPAEALDAVELRDFDTPDADDVAHLRSSSRREPARREAPRREPARISPAPAPAPRAPEPRPARAKASDGGRTSPLVLGVVAGLALAVVVLGGVGVWLLVGSGGGGDDVLQPVSQDLDALAGARPRSRFQPPPSEAGAAADAGALDVRPSGVARGAPGTSVVHVESDPPGAVVRIDGRVVGRTPVDVDLAFGAYSAELQLDGHAPARQILTVDGPRQALQATLRPIAVQGRARVVAPGWEGAVLLVDGAEVGAIPATIDLQLGQHTFLVRRGDDVLDVTRSVVVQPDGLVEVDLTK